MGQSQIERRTEYNNEYYIPGSAMFWRASLALFIASFLTFANIYLTQPLLPLLVEEFKVSPAVSSLTVSLTIFALGLTMLFLGPVSDAVGRRPVMLWTMAFAAVPPLLAPLVTSFNMLLLIRIAQGVFLAGLPSVAMAYLGEEFSPKALGLAVGLYISGNSIGGMSGRIISGMLADAYSWRVSFLVMGAIGVVGVALFYYLLPPSKHFLPRPAGFKNSAADLWGHLKKPTLLKAYGIAFVIMFSFVGVYNYITFRLSGPPYNLSPAAVGWLFLTYLSGTVSSTAAGRFIDLAGNRAAVIMGVIIALTGLLILAMPSLWVIIIGLLIFSFGFFAVHAAASAWVNAKAVEARAGAMALYLVFYYVGGSFGSTGLGFMWHYRGWAGVSLGVAVVLSMGLVLGFSLKHSGDGRPKIDNMLK